MEANQPPPGAAALIVQNGRLSGARRALALPLTLIGEAAGCDVRLNVNGVNPLHCAIVQVPGGLLLRDLGSEQGTYVNHEKATTWPLATGDVIGVGPFLFRVELPASLSKPEVEEIAGLAAERDALRIQAAAVAAQQAKLTDEEAQLNQRRDALEQREQQIAGHLDDRQRRMLELRDEIKQERAALEADKGHFEEKRAGLQKEFTMARKQAERERRRFSEARKRFKQRWLHYTAEQQTALRQHEQQFLTGRQALEKETEALQRERTHFTEVRQRLNGELEVGKRRLKEAWQELARAQQQWEVTLNVEQRERGLRLRSLEAQETTVAEAARKLAEDQRRWQDARAHLLKETQGLETRVLNQRYQLQEVQRELRPQAPVAVAVAVPPPEPPGSIHELPGLPATLQRLAGHLADQRWLLLEHWARFLQIEGAWQQERAALLAEAERTEGQLSERRRQLDGREHALEGLEVDVRQRRDRLARSQDELESRHTGLTLRETNWEGGRTAYLVAVEAREQTATALVEQLEAVRRRRQERRRLEVEELRQVRTRCEAARQEYLALIRRFQERQTDLAREQRTLAARTVALERHRLELLNAAANSPAADKRLEKLTRRSAARIEAGERKVTAQRQTLLAESRRLEERARQLQQREDELAALQEQLAQRQTEGEREQIALTQAELPRERELRLLKTQHEHDARQLAALRDEVERVARVLLDDAEAGTVQRAA
jgi:hypothetical protein